MARLLKIEGSLLCGGWWGLLRGWSGLQQGLRQVGYRINVQRQGQKAFVHSRRVAATCTADIRAEHSTKSVLDNVGLVSCLTSGTINLGRFASQVETTKIDRCRLSKSQAAPEFMLGLLDRRGQSGVWGRLIVYPISIMFMTCQSRVEIRGSLISKCVSKHASVR